MSKPYWQRSQEDSLRTVAIVSVIVCILAGCFYGALITLIAIMVQRMAGG